MHQLLNRVFAWLGALPPLRFVLLGAGMWAALTLAVLTLGPVVVAGSLGELVRIIGIAVLAVLASVVTWHRDDDPLEAGLLLAGIFLLSSSMVTVLLALLTPQDVVLFALMRQPFALFLPALVMIPACAALVWVARQLTTAATRGMAWWRTRGGGPTAATDDSARDRGDVP